MSLKPRSTTHTSVLIKHTRNERPCWDNKSRSADCLSTRPTWSHAQPHPAPGQSHPPRAGSLYWYHCSPCRDRQADQITTLSLWRRPTLTKHKVSKIIQNKTSSYLQRPTGSSRSTYRHEKQVCGFMVFQQTPLRLLSCSNPSVQG